MWHLPCQPARPRRATASSLDALVANSLYIRADNARQRIFAAKIDPSRPGTSSVAFQAWKRLTNRCFDIVKPGACAPATDRKETITRRRQKHFRWLLLGSCHKFASRSQNNRASSLRESAKEPGRPHPPASLDGIKTIPEKCRNLPDVGGPSPQSTITPFTPRYCQGNGFQCPIDLPLLLVIVAACNKARARNLTRLEPAVFQSEPLNTATRHSGRSGGAFATLEA